MTLIVTQPLELYEKLIHKVHAATILVPKAQEEADQTALRSKAHVVVTGTG